MDTKDNDVFDKDVLKNGRNQSNRVPDKTAFPYCKSLLPYFRPSAPGKKSRLSNFMGPVFEVFEPKMITLRKSSEGIFSHKAPLQPEKTLCVFLQAE